MKRPLKQRLTEKHATLTRTVESMRRMCVDTGRSGSRTEDVGGDTEDALYALDGPLEDLRMAIDAITEV